MFEILSKNTGQPLERIRQDCERDFIMSTDHALEYGIIDKILTHHEDDK